MHATVASWPIMSAVRKCAGLVVEIGATEVDWSGVDWRRGVASVRRR